MDQAARERIGREVTKAANQRFPGAVHGVVVLQHAIGGSVRPGEITIRVLIRPDLPGGPQRQLQDFEDRHRLEIEQFQRDLSQQFPRTRRLEFTHPDSGRSRIKAIETIVLLLDRAPGQPGKESTAASDLTPVMARLGPAELEIVDTLISASIAPNRAEAIRWSLARISERSAFAQLCERTREIERLRASYERGRSVRTAADSGRVRVELGAD